MGELNQEDGDPKPGALKMPSGYLLDIFDFNFDSGLISILVISQKGTRWELNQEDGDGDPKPGALTTAPD